MKLCILFALVLISNCLAAEKKMYLKVHACKVIVKTHDSEKMTVYVDARRSIRDKIEILQSETILHVTDKTAKRKPKKEQDHQMITKENTTVVFDEDGIVHVTENSDIVFQRGQRMQLRREGVEQVLPEITITIPCDTKCFINASGVSSVWMEALEADVSIVAKNAAVVDLRTAAATHIEADHTSLVKVVAVEGMSNIEAKGQSRVRIDKGSASRMKINAQQEADVEALIWVDSLRVWAQEQADVYVRRADEVQKKIQGNASLHVN